MPTIEEIQASDQYIYLTALITATLQLGCMDKLKETPYYKREVKKAANELITALERKMMPDVDEICGLQDKSLYAIMDYVERLILKIVTMRPEYIGVTLEMIERLEQQPEEVMKFLEIKLVETLP